MNLTHSDTLAPPESALDARAASVDTIAANGQQPGTQRHPASFRDPSGFMFRSPDGTLLRQVNASYESDYRALMESGLYEELIQANLMVAHTEVELEQAAVPGAVAVVQPSVIPFISHPYEWCFSQLQDAALLTLEIQRRAMEHGMSLKDASAYNIQFRDGRPVFIDTLSFEVVEPNRPWVAYGQFCRHFLAPLALLACTDIRLGGMLKNFLDGVPLDLAARLLPFTAKWRPGLAMHLVLHAKSCRKHQATSGDVAKQKKEVTLSKHALLGMLDSLRRCVQQLKWNPSGTEWEDYYNNLSYDASELTDKERIVQSFIQTVKPESVWDLGANTGRFSRLASREAAHTVAFDIDPGCVERNYLAIRDQGETHLLPLQIDLTNPSGGIGWAHEERASLQQRGPADLILALALIHHLAITNNVPLPEIAAYFRQLCQHLVIEWVPKSDPQVQRLLLHRRDIFSNYDQDSFEAAFSTCFRIEAQQDVGHDGRILYRMQAK